MTSLTPHPEYAPYGPLLIEMFERSAARFRAVLPGQTYRSDFCEYRVMSVEGEKVTIKALCGPSRSKVWRTSVTAIRGRLRTV